MALAWIQEFIDKFGGDHPLGSEYRIFVPKHQAYYDYIIEQTGCSRQSEFDPRLSPKGTI